MTDVSVPGPPDDLTLHNVTDTSVQLSWGLPVSTNGHVTEYRIVASLGQSFHKDRLRASDKVLEFSEATTAVTLRDLLPGSQYNISVLAGNSRGDFGPPAFSEVWTGVGLPDIPAPPEVIRWDRETGRVRLRVHTVEDNGGKIKNYQIIVGEGSLHSVGAADLFDYKRAEAAGLSHWISAQLSPDYLAARGGEITLGNGQLYGGYLNYGPLDSQTGYQLAVRVSQSLGGVTRYSLSDPVTSDTSQDRIVLRVSGDNRDYSKYRYETDPRQRDSQTATSSSALTTGLVVAVVLGALLLVAAVVVFLVVRRRAGRHFRRGRRPDTQELTQTTSQDAVQAAIDVEANGYIHDKGDTLRSGEEYLESLKSKVWLIPKNFVELSHEVVGRGRFGSVIKASVHNGGRVVPCTTQQASNMMGEEEHRALLHSLDISIRSGQHANIVCLMGLCQEVDTCMIVMELGHPSLKQYLLDCRALEHSPEYAAIHGRFSTAREEAVLEILVGLAEGLAHLAEKNISHGALCARNVLMCGQNTAKISGFGLADWSRQGELADLTRWRAPETTINNTPGVKADIWALGVLIWEALSLGGTPYSSVRSRDVLTRITRGLRLSRPAGVSDNLYQLILTCWMLDPDERPAPGEVVEGLRDMTHLASHHLNFTLPGTNFRYEQYEPQAELTPPSDAVGSYV